MPTLVAATISRKGRLFGERAPASTRRPSAMASAMYAPVMAAVRVPPSNTCSTSQSRMTVRSPSSFMSTTEAKAAADQPLDLMRAPACSFPFSASRGVRVSVAGEHAILRRDPAATGVTHPAWDTRFDGGIA